MTIYLYDWTCEKRSYTPNFKYLELQILKHLIRYISRMHRAACVHFYTNL